MLSHWSRRRKGLLAFTISLAKIGTMKDSLNHLSCKDYFHHFEDENTLDSDQTVHNSDHRNTSIYPKYYTLIMGNNTLQEWEDFLLNISALNLCLFQLIKTVDPTHKGCRKKCLRIQTTQPCFHLKWQLHSKSHNWYYLLHALSPPYSKRMLNPHH